jgi:ABC-type branched-subunit amino acid transport system ATPase component
LLQLRNISYSFAGTAYFLSKISMEIKPGNIYALTGPNGAGKTTLFNIITGYMKPQSGDILLNGNKINYLKPYQINRLGVGRTFQDLRLVASLTVKENVLLSMHDHPTDRWMHALIPAGRYKDRLKAMDDRAEQILSECFLLEVKNLPGDNISFGQQKLLTIACCIANEASILLLDEPVAGVTEAYHNKMITLLDQQRNAGKAILLIEHHKAFIDQINAIRFVLKEGILTPEHRQ